MHPETTTWKASSSICQSDSAHSDSATTARSTPDNTVYTTAHNDIAGGSDYWNPMTKQWENVSSSISNLQKEIDNLKLNFTIERVE